MVASDSTLPLLSRHAARSGAVPDAAGAPLRMIAPPPSRLRCAQTPPPLGKSRFTFLEILIAIAILGIALALALQIVGAARARLLRAERRWARQHNLDQVVEFYLLAGPDAALPTDLLPEGFSASCTVEPVPLDELPEFVSSEEYQGWTLARYRITLVWRGSASVQQQVVEKVIRADALP
ncbi:MAG: prepilin-type N-terminal cleavage/methylation domain-containing protein [Kiritimatiellaeota bacterium]|nr:prepilin-type N-terminal cleavage/methylation domain-containing protein [Kiritimatiellota bacterium]